MPNGIIASGSPTNGTSGTLVGICYPGDTLTNYTTGQVWVNTGTTASPTWLSLNSTTTPTTAQVMVAATTLLANGPLVQVSTASNITSTAAPTIADGVDGQKITIVNVGSFNYVLSDQGTLASSNLRLVTATVTLAPRGNVDLTYNATIGDWFQSKPLTQPI